MASRRIFMGVGVISTALCAVAALGDVQPTTLEQLQYFYPSVSARQNAALVYQAAWDARVEDHSDKNLPRISVDESPGIENKPLNPLVKASILKELERNSETLRLVHQANSMPLCRFPIDLTKWEEIELPHLAGLRQFAWLLELQAINAADDKNAKLAIESVDDIMAIARALRNEPVVMSQLLRAVCWDIAMNTLEQVLNRIPFQDAPLREFQESLAKADDPNAMTRAFQRELCHWMNVDPEPPEERAAREQAIAEYQEQCRRVELDLITKAENRLDSFEDETEAGSPEGVSNELAGNEAAIESSASADPFPVLDEKYLIPRLSPEQKQELVQEAKREVEESRLPYADFMKLIPAPYDPNAMTRDQYVQQLPRDNQLPYFRRSMICVARMAARAAAMQGVMAIERYRAKTGHLPNTWEDLIPDFLEAPISDPFVKDGAIIYRTTETGYVVYSLGQNGRDDGGTEGDGRPPMDHVFTIERPVQAEE